MGTGDTYPPLKMERDPERAANKGVGVPGFDTSRIPPLAEAQGGELEVSEGAEASFYVNASFNAHNPQRVSHEDPFVTQTLTELANLYRKRNAVYKDNYLMVGRVMKALFPDGVPRLETEHDFNRWHLFELAIVKLTRYVVRYQEGGHAPSLDDMIVYLAMVGGLDASAGHRDGHAVGD